MRMRLALLLAVAALAGCAVGPSRSEILASLVGHSEADAIRALGVPNRIVTANGSRFLGYDERRLDYGPAPGFGGFGPWGWGYGYAFAPSIPYTRNCETTIEVAGGVVRSWNLRGNAC